MQELKAEKGDSMRSSLADAIGTVGGKLESKAASEVANAILLWLESDRQFEAQSLLNALKQIEGSLGSR
jgi:hypothetical protein